MSSNYRSKMLGRRAPPPSRLPSPAFFLIWYLITSLSLILPVTWRNTGIDGWQLLTTALKAEMARICSVLPQSDREFKQELAYFTTVQRCIETANLTPRLMAAYEKRTQSHVFSLRRRNRLAVQASLYLDLLLYTKKIAFLKKAVGIKGLLYCDKASALYVPVYAFLTLVKYVCYSCFWRVECIFGAVSTKVLCMIVLCLPGAVLFELHWMFHLSLESHLRVSDWLLYLTFFAYPLLLLVSSFQYFSS